MSYGTNFFPGLVRRGRGMADKIYARCEDANTGRANRPHVRSRINLTTAKALGRTIRLSLIRPPHDEVIEWKGQSSTLARRQRCMAAWPDYTARRARAAAWRSACGGSGVGGKRRG